MQYIKSNKNKNLLVHNSYIYRVDRKAVETVYWRCIVKNCKGRITIRGESISKGPSYHIHVPDINIIESRKIVENMKNKVCSSNDNPQQIIASSQITPGVAGNIPSIPLLKRTLRRARQKKQNVPQNPSSLVELEIPEIYTKTKNGHPFLIFDSGQVENRILIYSTEKNLKLMEKSKHWFADGTFKSSPVLFFQIYTIHVLINDDTIIPTVYALLPNKTQDIYTLLLSKIKEINPNLNPETIMTDFEHSSLIAFKNIFPNIKQSGCFFHFTQCLWRKIQKIPGLAEKYISDPNFSLHIRMLPALAYVPKSYVVTAFEELLNSQFYIDNDDLLKPLIEYFEDNWIGRLVGRRQMTRRTPTFPLELWNCYDLAKKGLPRTNNNIEGWHRGFSTLLGMTSKI